VLQHLNAGVAAVGQCCAWWKNDQTVRFQSHISPIQQKTLVKQCRVVLQLFHWSKERDHV